MQIRRWPRFIGGVAIVSLLAGGLRVVYGQPLWVDFLFGFVGVLIGSWLFTTARN
jgi:hypothetical protein